MSSAPSMESTGLARIGQIPIDVKKLVRQAKYRAKKKGLPFALDVSGIQVPVFCPILGIRLQPSLGQATDASPTLDRVKPELGYVEGNVLVISNLANRIKSSADYTAIGHVSYFLSQPSLNKKAKDAIPNVRYDPILDGHSGRGASHREYNPTTDLKQPLYHDSGNIPPEGPHPHYQARYPDADGGAVHCHCEHG